MVFPSGQVNGLVSHANVNNSHNLTRAHRIRDTASGEYVDTAPPHKVRFASETPGEICGIRNWMKASFPSETNSSGNKRKSGKLRQHRFTVTPNQKTNAEKDRGRSNVQSAKSQVIG